MWHESAKVQLIRLPVNKTVNPSDTLFRYKLFLILLYHITQKYKAVIQ